MYAVDFNPRERRRQNRDAQSGGDQADNGHRLTNFLGDIRGDTRFGQQRQDLVMQRGSYFTREKDKGFFRQMLEAQRTGCHMG
ncbi:hypothetical protein D3C78_1566490 [compost metagenome]